jgi:hypothetical protein
LDLLTCSDLDQETKDVRGIFLVLQTGWVAVSTFRFQFGEEIPKSRTLLQDFHSCTPKARLPEFNLQQLWQWVWGRGSLGLHEPTDARDII